MMTDTVKSQLENSDQYSKPGPNFHEKNGPGGPLFLEFWSSDQNFRRTKISVTGQRLHKVSNDCVLSPLPCHFALPCSTKCKVAYYSLSDSEFCSHPVSYLSCQHLPAKLAAFSAGGRHSIIIVLISTCTWPNIHPGWTYTWPSCNQGCGSDLIVI